MLLSNNIRAIIVKKLINIPHPPVTPALVLSEGLNVFRLIMMTLISEKKISQSYGEQIARRFMKQHKKFEDTYHVIKHRFEIMNHPAIEQEIMCGVLFQLIEALDEELVMETVNTQVNKIFEEVQNEKIV